MMAKTSFHARFFAERTTMPIVNPRAHVSISFVLDSNLVRINQKMQIVRIDPIAHPIRGRRPSYPKAGARSKQPLIREAPWSVPAFWRFEPNSNESAVIIVRPAANTTAIVSGKNNTTGDALVEVYILPP